MSEKTIKYVWPVEDEDERTRRKDIDELVNKVHEDHRSISAVQEQQSLLEPESLLERQSLLEQFIRLPGDPRSNEVAARSPGEILVSFYNYELPLRIEPDEDSDNDGQSGRRVSSPPPPENEESKETICLPVPLPYLYNFPSNGAEMINKETLLGLLPGGFVSGPNLRIIEFPMTDYAADFLKAMKNVSLGSLINDPKAAMTKVKTNEHSSFLTGISYYPSIPPRRLVSSREGGRKIFYHPDTMIFISIPYLGLESKASALLRRKSPLRKKSALPQLGIEQTQDEMAERLTGYHVIDNLTAGELPCNSSLSLLEHRYPSQPDIATSDVWRKAWGETREKRPVVHQMWFMVFDHDTIAAFRSGNDIQSENLPLHPNNFQSIGAYHGVINMMSNIMDSSNSEILEMFGQTVSDLEPLLAEAQGGSEPTQASSPDELLFKVKAVKFELQAITRVVKAQVKVLENLSRFELASAPEEFRTMRRTISAVIKDRKVFCEEIGDILEDLLVIEGGVDKRILKETAKARDKAIRDQLTLVADAAAESTNAATESKAAAELSMQAATRSAEASKNTEETSRQAVEASKSAERAATQSAAASSRTEETSKQTANAAEASKDASTKNAKQTEGQGAKMTVFTVITTVFTPLNFFTSYLGMNVYDIRSTQWTQYQFWEMTAPITFAILVFALVVAFRREWIRSAMSLSSSSSVKSLYQTSRSTLSLNQNVVPPAEGRPSVDVESQNSTRTMRSGGWSWILPSGIFAKAAKGPLLSPSHTT